MSSGAPCYIKHCCDSSSSVNSLAHRIALQIKGTKICKVLRKCVAKTEHAISLKYLCYCHLINLSSPWTLLSAMRGELDKLLLLKKKKNALETSVIPSGKVPPQADWQIDQGIFLSQKVPIAFCHGCRHKLFFNKNQV